MISILSTKDEDLSSNETVVSLAKDLCMHIAATSPVCVSRDDVPADLISKEKDIAMAQAEGAPTSHRKNCCREVGKVFFRFLLIRAAFCKRPDSSVKDLLAKTSSELGTELSVGTFLRFQVGENS